MLIPSFLLEFSVNPSKKMLNKGDIFVLQLVYRLWYCEETHTQFAYTGLDEVDEDDWQIFLWGKKYYEKKT